MRYILTGLSLFIFVVSFSQQHAYKQAWKALDNNDRKQAEALLQQAMKDPATASDAFITNLYLQTYNGKEAGVNDFSTTFHKRADNPYPYVFALWFNQAVLGGYGKKTLPWQLKFADELIKDPKAPGTLAAAASYQRIMHHIYSAEFDKTASYARSIGAITDWQFTGPFENLSQSGFFKNYGPPDHPEPDATFKSMTNADIKWFTPASQLKDGWVLLNYHFSQATAVVYAQSFVNAPTEQDVLCNAGFAGAIKVWINDELLISEAKELGTEMDNTSVKYRLKKGTNRVLVQLSYSNMSVPSFCIRLTDQDKRPLPNLTASSSYAAYQKSNIQGEHPVLAHFAQDYFAKKIAAEPENPVNYMLLADVYIRSRNMLEARNTLQMALDKAPHNSMMRVKLLDILAQENNRTLALEELERLKQDDPECLMVLEYNISEFYDNERYQDCEAELDKRIRLYGEDENTASHKIKLLAQDKKYEEMIRLVEKLYARYPNNSGVITIMYNIKKDVNRDKKGAMKVLEKYMSHAYSYSTYMDYAEDLIGQGDIKKGLGIKERLLKLFPYDAAAPYGMASYYYGIKQFEKAEQYLEQSISLAPYVERYWELSGDIKSARNNKAGALQAYDRALKLNPNQYSLITKIRKLNDKPEIFKLFNEEDVTKVIEKDNPSEAKNTDYGYYYILDQKDVVLYPEGGSEEFITAVIRITNEKGVDRFKTSSLGYKSSQSLLIEKAEVIKANKTRIEGERNDNQIVFTNLEAGDVVHFRYRLQDYASGRLGKEYWDKFYFTGQIYTASGRYSLLAPAARPVHYAFSNKSVDPVISNVEDFKMYRWTIDKAEPLTEEPLMPLSVDAGCILHVSTIATWQDIANWYSDAVHNKSEENLEIRSLYNSLFPAGSASMSEYQKARTIYNYITSNIRYSSVPFRQGPLIPQRAATTVTSRLGDCKDLSNLFVTLAHMAGINAQLVLVDTRDNGRKDVLLPSMDFNHCIAKAVLDQKSYYIELTDNYLPFASLPNNLHGAIALEVPSKSLNEKAALIYLHPENRTRDIVKRTAVISPDGDDLRIRMQTVKYGSATSQTRYDFRNLNNEKQRQDMEKSVGGSYKNNIRMDLVEFGDLDRLDDSVVYKVQYVVKNEINEIGSMKTFKITFHDIVATLDNFSAETRNYPIEYWRYEDVDEYESTIDINIPSGSQFVEVPKAETLDFGELHYTISYKLVSPEKLLVTRKFSNNRVDQISPKDYPAFKAFFEKIVKAEQKFIAYK